jgi:hypothetical protein
VLLFPTPEHMIGFFIYPIRALRNIPAHSGHLIFACGDWVPLPANTLHSAACNTVCCYFHSSKIRNPILPAILNVMNSSILAFLKQEGASKE